MLSLILRFREVQDTVYGRGNACVLPNFILTITLLLLLLLTLTISWYCSFFLCRPGTSEGHSSHAGGLASVGGSFLVRSRLQVVRKFILHTEFMLSRVYFLFFNACVSAMSVKNWGRIQRKTWCIGPYTGGDFNLTLCPLQSRIRHISHGHWATLFQRRP